MKCSNCESSIDPAAKFCPNCGSRLKCDGCGEVLEPGAKFCTNCGESIIPTSPSYSANPDHRSPNSINFKESRTHRKFGAEVSDSVAIALSEALAALVGAKLFTNGIRASSAALKVATGQLAIPEVIDVQVTPKSVVRDEFESVPEGAADPISNGGSAFDLFRALPDGGIALRDPSLRALNQSEYVRRLVCLYNSQTNVRR